MLWGTTLAFDDRVVYNVRTCKRNAWNIQYAIKNTHPMDLNVQFVIFQPS